MQHAIEVLKQRLETAEHNGKIRRDSGNTEQADLDDAVAKECKAAIAVLVNAGDAQDAAILNTLRDKIANGQYEYLSDYEKFIQATALRKQAQI